MNVLRLVLFSILFSLLLQPASHAMRLADDLGLNNKTSNMTTWLINQQLRIQNSHQAGQLVQRQYGGKILKVSKRGKGSQVTFVVKVLRDNGDVISVTVDAASGRVSRR